MMMTIAKIKKHLRNNKITKVPYFYFKRIKQKRIEANKLNYHGVFIDRSRGERYLCVVLAGYKDYLYPITFKRLVRFLPDDIDVCIATSGKYSDTIAKECEKNGWSYLSTRENNVSLVQNIAIQKHAAAAYIFKLDEDIFITEDYFSNMIRAYEHTKLGAYHAGVVAPIIPVNGFGYVQVLKMLDLLDYYEERFEKPLCITGAERQSESNPETAKLFWGEGEVVPSIDQLNRMVQSDPIEEIPCPIRFSIGAVLFERDLWEKMGYFKVNRRTNNMGADEEELCTFCMLNSRPILVSKNVVVGHLSFGRANSEMQKYFEANPEKFDIGTTEERDMSLT